MNLILASPHRSAKRSLVCGLRLSWALSAFLFFALLVAALCAVMLCLSPTAVFAVDNGKPVLMTAPPEPAVPPEIPAFGNMDKDRNRLDDQLDTTIQQVKNAIASETDPVKKGSLQAKLVAPAQMEFVFSRQITQKQIDDFLALGGKIDHIYQAVSYGWNGSVPLGLIEKFRDSMGDSLVGIVGEKEVRACMDEAGRTGRVRLVWVSGFAGSPGGFSGSNTTTICIMDTGIDDSHTDLTGRQEFWKDYTSAGLTSPADVNGHGSHVAGIALGTGNSGGTGTITLRYTDSGDLTGVPAGSFYPAPMHILNGVSTTFTSTAYWNVGKSASLYEVYQPNGSTASYSAISAATTGTSPITEANSFTASSANHYSAALVQSTPPKVTKFAVTNTVTNYPGAGDSFNNLRGVAPGCRWAGSRVLSDSGSGTSANIYTALDDAVVQRVAHNIKIVSMSFGMTGAPGIDTTMRAKVNTLVNNGIIAVVAAGNDGPGTAGANLVDDPGRAALAITVAASNDINQLTSYTSSGFASPGVDEDYKPDLMAPGGSAYYSMILSVDSNDADAEDAAFPDKQTNDYTNINGTSMATPFAAGAAALVIQALESAGLTWSFSSSAHPMMVKMLLCATCTESNAPREVSSGTNPTLGRAASPKDLYEGYGMLNPDAAVEAVSLSYTGGNLVDGTTGDYFDRRAWARKVVLAAGGRVIVSLTVPATADYDLYLYSGSPDSKGNPVIRASSTNTASGAAESIDYTSTSGETVYMVIKRVSGNGNWTLTGTVGNDTIPPTVSSIVRKTPPGQYYNSSSVVWTVTFNELINAATVSTGDFTLVDVSSTITGESITNVTPTTGTATAFDVTAGTGSGNGALRLDVIGATATINDVSGNDITADYTSGETYIIDKTAPTVVLSDNHPDAIVRDADTIIITATFTEANGINEASPPTISITNGGVTNAPMSRPSNLVWTYTWNVPTGNAAATVSISATDIAGNPNSPATGKTAYTIDNTVHVADLAALKAKAGAGEIVKLTGNVTVTCKNSGLFFVGEARFKGCIKVVGDDVVTAGAYLTNLIGIVTVDGSGQYTITLSAPVSPAASGAAIGLVGINNKSAKTDAKLLTNRVRVWGLVSGATITDGYSAPITVITPPSGTGFVVINGVIWKLGGDVVLYQDLP